MRLFFFLFFLVLIFVSFSLLESKCSYNEIDVNGCCRDFNDNRICDDDEEKLEFSFSTPEITSYAVYHESEISLKSLQVEKQRKNLQTYEGTKKYEEEKRDYILKRKNWKRKINDYEYIYGYDERYDKKWE